MIKCFNMPSLVNLAGHEAYSKNILRKHLSAGQYPGYQPKSKFASILAKAFPTKKVKPINPEYSGCYISRDKFKVYQGEYLVRVIIC